MPRTAHEVVAELSGDILDLTPAVPLTPDSLFLTSTGGQWVGKFGWEIDRTDRTFLFYNALFFVRKTETADQTSPALKSMLYNWGAVLVTYVPAFVFEKLIPVCVR